MRPEKRSDDKTLLESLIQTMPAILGLVELEKNELHIIMGNTEFARFCRVDTVSGKKLADLVPEFVAKQWVKCCREAQKTTNAEFHFAMEQNGHQYFYAGTCYASGFSTNKNPTFGFYVHDVTEEKKLSLKLEQNERFLSIILESLPVALFCKDVKNEYRFVLWNKKSQELFGMKKDAVIGKNDYDFFPKDQADFFRKIDEQTMKNGFLVDVAEETITTPDQGNKYLHTLKVPVLDEAGKGEFLLGITEDITEKKKAQVQLVQTSKMSSLGQMAAGIAHEINNPLTVIHGKATQIRDAAQKNNLQSETVVNDATKIRDMAMRIARIVKGLRTFSRGATGDPMQIVPLGTLVDDTLEFCRSRLLTAGVALKVDVDPTIEVVCRPHEISQVFLNLLNNALDAITEKSTPWVMISAITTDDKVQVRVSDSGDGVPDDLTTKIMEPFFTTKEVGRGTGLGLSISKALMEAHHGALFYEKSAKHTTFVMEFPKKSV